MRTSAEHMGMLTRSFTCAPDGEARISISRCAKSGTDPPSLPSFIPAARPDPCAGPRMVDLKVSFLRPARWSGPRLPRNGHSPRTYGGGNPCRGSKRGWQAGCARHGLGDDPAWPSCLTSRCRVGLIVHIWLLYAMKPRRTTLVAPAFGTTLLRRSRVRRRRWLRGCASRSSGDERLKEWFTRARWSATGLGLRRTGARSRGGGRGACAPKLDAQQSAAG